MTNLSVNINKVALIRNARGSDLPNVGQFAVDCESYGAHGITVHPRPDQRHVRFDDIPVLSKLVQTELNIEGFPNDSFMFLIEKNRPTQCTLVPDPPDALTSNTGWNVIKEKSFLEDVISQCHSWGIRVSIFVNPISKMCEEAKKINADRIEFYTGPYAHQYMSNPPLAIQPYYDAAKTCDLLGLDINAGHDLNLLNLSYFIQQIPSTKEVSIGHALISDALYYGIKNTIQMYLSKLDTLHIP
ncbi:MAG: pyridoxine 5'-phosphate synthase [Saprospiraceae bacterium]